MAARRPKTNTHSARHGTADPNPSEPEGKRHAGAERVFAGVMAAGVSHTVFAVVISVMVNAMKHTTEAAMPVLLQ